MRVSLPILGNNLQ